VNRKENLAVCLRPPHNKRKMNYQAICKFGRAIVCEKNVGQNNDTGLRFAFLHFEFLISLAASPL